MVRAMPPGLHACARPGLGRVAGGRGWGWGVCAQLITAMHCTAHVPRASRDRTLFRAFLPLARTCLPPAWACLLQEVPGGLGPGRVWTHLQGPPPTLSRHPLSPSITVSRAVCPRPQHLRTHLWDEPLTPCRRGKLLAALAGAYPPTSPPGTWHSLAGQCEPRPESSVGVSGCRRRKGVPGRGAACVKAQEPA